LAKGETRCREKKDPAKRRGAKETTSKQLQGEVREKRRTKKFKTAKRRLPRSGADGKFIKGRHNVHRAGPR